MGRVVSAVVGTRSCSAVALVRHFTREEEEAVVVKCHVRRKPSSVVILLLAAFPPGEFLKKKRRGLHGERQILRLQSRAVNKNAAPWGNRAFAA
jgi:hypothetical protein